MLHDLVKKGSVDRSVTVRVIDAIDGTPETGVVYNTSGIDLWYRREGAAKTSITEATLASLTTAHADGGFLHVSDGVYRLDLPDAAFATGANYVDFGGTVTGMIVIGGRVRLVDFNPEQDIPAGVWAYVIENSKSALAFMRLIYSATVNKVSGGGTSSVAFRDDADTKDRIVATVDSDGNRTSVTKDAS